MLQTLLYMLNVVYSIMHLFQFHTECNFITLWFTFSVHSQTSLGFSALMVSVSAVVSHLALNDPFVWYFLQVVWCCSLWQVYWAQCAVLSVTEH